MMRGAAYTLLLLLLGVSVHGWNPLNRTEIDSSDSITEFEDDTRKISHPSYETEQSPLNNSTDVEPRANDSGELPEIDEYRVASITKRAVQTKKVAYKTVLYSLCFLKRSISMAPNGCLVSIDSPLLSS